MAKNYQISWKQGDYIRLGQAISKFNKTIQKLENEEKKLNLPKLEDYKRKKENIKTRKELDSYIKSLNKLQNESMQESQELEGGQLITKWEYEVLKQARTQAKKSLGKELKQLKEVKIQGTNYTRAQMGSERVRQIERSLESLDKLESKTNYEFQRIAERIKYYGTKDYLYKKNYVFKQNYLKMLENFENFNGNEEFKEKLESLHPDDFYNFLTKNGSFLKTTEDIIYMYDTAKGATAPEGFSSQDMFDKLLDELEIKRKNKRTKYKNIDLDKIKEERNSL